MIKKISILTLVLSLTLTLSACNNTATDTTEEANNDTTLDESIEEEVTSDVTQEETEEPEETEESEDVKVFELEAGMYYFTPDEITVQEGDTVRIVINNVEGMHDWVLDEFDARTEIVQAGETAEVEFVAGEAGTYEFYCSVANHREMGMVGTLTVEPAE